MRRRRSRTPSERGAKHLLLPINARRSSGTSTRYCSKHPRRHNHQSCLSGGRRLVSRRGKFREQCEGQKQLFVLVQKSKRLVSVLKRYVNRMNPQSLFARSWLATLEMRTSSEIVRPGRFNRPPDCCIKWVWLDGGAWLSLACAPLFRSARRASICARLASAASRWSCNSHPISNARRCISTP